MTVILATLLGMTACDNEENSISNNANARESIYGEWRLVGWYDQGTWFEVDTNYVSHRSLSIEIPEEGVPIAHSLVNEIYLGELTVDGNELHFGAGRGQTKVGCDMMESVFFENHIYDIKSYQLEGNLLRLYYSDADFFVFTSNFDDSEDFVYAWKDCVADPFIGKVLSISNESVEVETFHYASKMTYYFHNMPPTNKSKCYINPSDLSGLSFSVGDKIAYRIIQFRKLKSTNREYQCVVEPCKGSEHVSDAAGVMHYDTYWKFWCIMIITDKDNNHANFYYPLKPLPKSYQSEGKSVVFSGELYPTWITPSQMVYRAESCYFVSLDDSE